MNFFRGIYDDMLVLKTIWFSSITGDTHKDRLDSFYGPQAHAYDRFRANFLHGRRPLLQSCATQMKALSGQPGLVWVDLGGGTGENIDMMNDYMDISLFEKIYMVDLCGPLCEVARQKAEKKGWKNVEVVEGDVCDFVPKEGSAKLVTFSYSLSMIPPFMDAVDKALGYLDRSSGVFGIADFITSSKFDQPGRQHGYLTRWFWRAVFDLDGINLSPERRMYIEHHLQRVSETNGRGKIPYVPWLRAPFYVWIGRHRA
eukprot:TRINITY_DN2756_c0_g1_i1.p1 TRINITY_DN2756_c0_g1~~TRINITY_DN2756_c0_g1_i1.p1  ORF type:complete len:302 (+),score=45.35 TRINITY_DN2756_c0_g1_i1:137-907(+)